MRREYGSIYYFLHLIDTIIIIINYLFLNDYIIFITFYIYSSFI